jgi:hypothetical protein
LHPVIFSIGFPQNAFIAKVLEAAAQRSPTIENDVLLAR